MALEVEVFGIDEVNRSLRGFSRRLRDKVVISAMREGAKVMQRQAKANAPRKTGKLRRNIMLRKSKINYGLYITVRSKGKASSKKNAFYGRFIHDGWNVRGRCQTGTDGKGRCAGRPAGKGKGRVTTRSSRNVPGVHFIRRAYATRRADAVNVTRRSFFAAARVVARKAGLKYG